MKVILSQLELSKMATKHFGYEVTEVILETPDNNTPLHEILRKAVERFAYAAHEKITAIKELRTACGNAGQSLGLANAKYAVENWAKWIEFVRVHNRLPHGDYLYTGDLK